MDQEAGKAGTGQPRRRWLRRFGILAGVFAAVYVAALFLAPVAIPFGPWDLTAGFRQERAGEPPPQGLSYAETTGLPGGNVSQLSLRLGERSLVLTSVRSR